MEVTATEVLTTVECIQTGIDFGQWKLIGSRAPLSSKRPLLSLCVSVCLFVCLSVRCPRPFTHFQLTDLDETWQLGLILALTRCFEVSATGAP